MHSMNYGQGKSRGDDSAHTLVDEPPEVVRRCRQRQPLKGLTRGKRIRYRKLDSSTEVESMPQHELLMERMTPGFLWYGWPSNHGGCANRFLIT